MTPAEIFPIGALSAMPVWALMIFLPDSKITRFLIDYKIVPIGIGIIYAVYIAMVIKSQGMLDFGSFASVKELFTNDQAIIAGWMHYVCFDLLIGMWMVDQNQKLRINKLVMAPCLFLTFMFGPVGFLLFMIIKTFKTSQS